MRVTVTTNNGTVLRILDSTKGNKADNLEGVMCGEEIAEADFMDAIAIALIQAHRLEMNEEAPTGR